MICSCSGRPRASGWSSWRANGSACAMSTPIAPRHRRARPEDHWLGEPAPQVASPSPRDLFDGLQRDLVGADVLRVVDERWLADAELRREVDASDRALSPERRPGRVRRRLGRSLRRTSRASPNAGSLAERARRSRSEGRRRRPPLSYGEPSPTQTPLQSVPQGLSITKRQVRVKHWRLYPLRAEFPRDDHPPGRCLARTVARRSASSSKNGGRAAASIRSEVLRTAAPQGERECPPCFGSVAVANAAADSDVTGRSASNGPAMARGRPNRDVEGLLRREVDVVNDEPTAMDEVVLPGSVAWTPPRTLVGRLLIGATRQRTSRPGPACRHWSGSRCCWRQGGCSRGR